MTSPLDKAPPTTESAWALLLALRDHLAAGGEIVDGVALGLDARGALDPQSQAPWLVPSASAPRGWLPPAGLSLSPDVDQLFDLYVPVCLDRAAVVAHLGQTLDGRIAVTSGESKFITGDDDLLHAHRLRALCDAVIVGRRTVEGDDPELTTRRCRGANPVRVVLDPQRALAERYRVFQNDVGTTLLFCSSEAAERGAPPGRAELVAVGTQGGELPVDAIVTELARRKLRRLYVEGGGVTISRFLAARALTRLQITVAPVVFGSGIPSVTLPPIRALADAVPLRARTFMLGRDTLFDCELAI